MTTPATMPSSARFIGSCCMAAWAGAAAADDAGFGSQALALAQPPSSLAAPAVEVTRAAYPRLSEPQAPAGGSVQYTDITRWMTPDRPGSLGVSLGVASTAAPAAASPLATPWMPVGVDMGVRWRSRLERGRHVDVVAWARAPQNVHTPDAMQLIWLAQQPTYGTRVEMQWSSSRTGGIVPEFGAIGMQLEGGSRLVLRAKRGKPMLYYRAKF